jgi:hypothetical protein
VKTIFALILSSGIALAASLPLAVHAVPYSAQVEFDFNEGWIRITPPEYRIGEWGSSGSRLEGFYRSSGLGISFDLFKVTSSLADLSADSYLYLSGNPDLVQFKLVQFLCPERGSTPYGSFTSEWTLAAMKGHIQVESYFLLYDSRQPALNLKGVCADDYRLQMSEFGFRGLANQQAGFTQSILRGQLSIQCNAKNWHDALAKRAYLTIERIDKILPNSK